MENYKKAIFPALLTFIFTFIVDASFDYFTGSRGELYKSEQIKINDTKYVLLSVNNYSNSVLNDMLISIPGDVDISTINASFPVNIEVPGGVMSQGVNKQIKVSGFAPNAITTLFVPTNKEVTVVNSKEKNIDLIDARKVDDPLKNILVYSLVTAFIYAVVFYFVDLKHEIRSRKEIKRLQDVEEKLELERKESKKVGEHLQIKLLEANNRISRIHIVLMSRISDYTKELDFWRNTIKKLLCSNKEDIKNSERLFEVVTDELKTYQTRNNNFTEAFKTAEVMAAMMKKD